MEQIVAARVDLPYEARTRLLIESRIALWDVCAGACRSGSLDSAIRSSTITPNDFCAFFTAHTDIVLICFNGRRAATFYESKVLKALPKTVQDIPRMVLPSTSPANTSKSFEEKLLCWRDALRATFPVTTG
jgi:double-stranded uracil-DNA glycosylase